MRVRVGEGEFEELAIIAISTLLKGLTVVSHILQIGDAPTSP